MKTLLKTFWFLRYLRIVAAPTPSSRAACFCETYSTVSPVSMFVAKTVLEQAAVAAAEPLAKLVRDASLAA